MSVRDRAVNVWNVLTLFVLLAAFLAAWGVVARMALWQPPMVEGYR